MSGMSCSACSARVERAVAQLSGVRCVQVNLLTANMRVQHSEELSTDAIINAVEAAGYHAESTQRQTALPLQKSDVLKQRFLFSLGLLLPLIAVHHLWHHNCSSLVQLLLAAPILFLNRHFFINGLQGVRKRAANMDTLVALGAGAAMVDGLANFWFHHRAGYYFESAAMIVTFITLGKWLESRATARTGTALKSLLALLPHTATISRDGQPTTIPAAQVKPDDIVLIKPGTRIPVDSIVTDGHSSVDESALTGESLPVEKTPGSRIYAGTLNQHGALTARAIQSTANSVISEVISLVGDAAATKAPISRLADRISGVFVPIVITISLLTAALWLFLGAHIGFAISCAIAVLVISCPCALGLATPVAIMVGTGKGAELGILFRNGETLENTHNATAIILDKTGTITSGHPTVTDILPAPGHTSEELLNLATALEADSNHPLAEAVRQLPRATSHPTATNHTYHPGKGLTATLQDIPCAAGNAAFMHELGITTPDTAPLAADGKTPLFFARGKNLIGTLAVADSIKAEAPAAISTFKRMGLHVAMITGDNIHTATAIARQVGIEHVYADSLPQHKDAQVRRLQAEGYHVAMVGDGINDAPALMRADVGIAIGAGTDIAMESAGIILVRSNLMDVVSALQLSRAVLSNIRQNLFWALLYNCLAIPLAAGAFYPLTGWLLHPAAAAAAMGLSSFCVVSNALRLRRFTPSLPSYMNTIIIKVDGMMCPHCEAHVTRALLAIPGVTDCRADFKAKQVTLTTTRDIPLSILHTTITNQGYTVL